MLLCIPMVEVLHRPALVIPIVAAGIAVQIIAVLVAPLSFVLLIRSQSFQREALHVGGRNRIDFSDIYFNPSYSQIVGHWILLRCLLHVPPAAGNSQDARLMGTRLYDAIPPQAWESAAAWDFIWNLRRSNKPSGETPANPDGAAASK
jgi:hypothetical protein